MDKFHYRKALNYIFKKEPQITKIADEYLRNNSKDSFKELVELQIKKYPKQQKYMKEKENYLINNIEGIKNQHHPLYKCPCSIEGHISNKYAKFITSRPHSYSEEGLENIVQLLTMKANNINLTPEICSKFKTETSIYHELNLEKIESNFKISVLDAKTKYKNNRTYNIDCSSFSQQDIYRTDYFLSKRA